jgi:hypothetical protein
MAGMTITCPVCEHAQLQGSECEVCGKRLTRGPSAADLALPGVPELEPTSHAPVDVDALRLADLEPTRQAGGAAAPIERVPDLEATCAAPVDVSAETVPGIEPTSAAIPGDAPTALPALMVCRYCRTPAAPGERICGRCGMRLPVVATGGDAAALEPRLCSCGAPVRGSLCPACGARPPQ